MPETSDKLTVPKAISPLGRPPFQQAGPCGNPERTNRKTLGETKFPGNISRIEEELALAEFELSIQGHLIDSAPASQLLRIDGPHAQPDGPVLQKENPSSAYLKKNTEGTDYRWTVFLLGLGSAVCGGTVVGWGMTLSELNLVYWGIPIFVLGMGLITAGLFFVAARRPAEESAPGLHDSPREIVAARFAAESSGD